MAALATAPCNVDELPIATARVRRKAPDLPVVLDIWAPIQVGFLDRNPSVYPLSCNASMCNQAYGGGYCVSEWNGSQYCICNPGFALPNCTPSELCGKSSLQLSLLHAIAALARWVRAVETTTDSVDTAVTAHSIPSGQIANACLIS